MDKRRIYLAAFFVSNIAALIFEVVWGRELTHVFGTSVYAVSTVLTSFMSGLALGSYIFGRLVDVSKNPEKLFARLEIGLGVYGLFTIYLFDVVSLPYGDLHRAFHGGLLFNFIEFLLAFFLLLIPTTFMGATFPVITKLYHEKFDELGSDVGKVYTVDMLGAATGSFVSGFLLIPILGHTKTIILASFLNVLVGLFIYDMAEEDLE